jgi:hypothetical protein
MAAIQLAHELIARRTEQAPVLSPDEISLRLRARRLSAEIETEITRQEALS